MTNSDFGNLPSVLLAQIPKSARILSLECCGTKEIAILSGRQISLNDESWNKLAEIRFKNGEQAVRSIRKIADESWEYLLVRAETYLQIQSQKAFCSRFEKSFPAIFGDDGIGMVFDLRLADQQPELKDFLAEFKKRERRYPSVLNWQVYQSMGCFFPRCIVFTPPEPDAQALPYIDSSIDIVLVPENDFPKKLEAKRVAKSAIMEIAIMPEKNPWLSIKIERHRNEAQTDSKPGQVRKKWLGQITPAHPQPWATGRDLSENQNGIRLVAFYYPQFYPIPETDAELARGFTDWRDVCNAKPLFQDHHQPHLPSDLGFYDLRLPETCETQANLARTHGIEAFCYWHHWFKGKQLSASPFDEVLESGKPDFPFCLCWANEPWAGREDRLKEEDVPQSQTYSAEDDLKHIRWLIGPLSDPRAFRIHGKPVFLICRAHRLPNPSETTACWRREAERAGLPGLYLMALETEWDEGWDATQAGFDAKILFQPQSYLLDQVPELDLVPSKVRIFDYDETWRVLLNPQPVPYLCYNTVFPGWDNSARFGENACVVDGNRPSSYEDWLSLSVQRAMKRPKDERIVFINAWNAWSEGAHLEPDRKHGRGFLEATQRVVASTLATQP